MKDRITEFLVKENISPAEFADKIGVQRSSVSHVLNGRNYPGASFIQKMLTSYRSLNPRWLLLGEGLMMEKMDVKSKITEPSLFPLSSTETTREENKKPERAIMPGIYGTFESSETQVKGIETSYLKNPEKEIHPEISEMISKVAENKEIEKIVLFYSDKTFSVYTSSK